MVDEHESEAAGLRPEALLGAALRRTREERGISLRTLAKKLYRSHSTLVEYERGHRLAPLDVVQAYEAELSAAPGRLAALHEQAQVELYGKDGSRRQTYVLSPGLHAPHQLPPDVAHFTGREAELAELHMLLAEGAPETVAISAIAGTAGVGKTALALRLAHELTPRFPDAQLYVNLHGYDPLQRLVPAQALRRFLRALGVAAEALPSDLDEQIALYRGLLADRRALVILDNASCPDQVRSLLPGSPNCLVLITTRDRLAGLIAQEGARLLVLDVLPSDKALELLARIAGGERVRAEPEAAARVAHLCGYLPLAVSIAATRLVTRPTMSLATLARRLADEQHRLRELAAGDVEVRASFALSYRGLAPDLACMFRRLGLIAGPDFAPGVAAALTHTIPEEAEELLEALVDAHLLETAPTPGRYRFHDLLHLYARERAQADETDSDRDAALRRMLAWYLDSVTAADQILTPGRRGLLWERAGDWPGPISFTPAQAVAWCDTEWANLMAATHQAAACRLHDIAWQIPDALYCFASLRRHWMDWRDACLVGCAAARQACDLEAEAWMLTGVGAACRGLRRFEEAIDCLQQALAIHREMGDRRGEVWAIGYLGRAHRNLGHFDEAIGYLALSHLGLGRFDEAAGHLGLSQRNLGHFDEAIGYFQEALAIHRETGDRYGEAWDLHDLGSTHAGLRRFDKAINSLHDALAIHREVGDRRGQAWALGYLGLAHLGLGRFDEAARYFQDALAMAQEVGHRYGEGLALRGLGNTYAGLRRFGEAIDCLQQDLEIHREIGDRYGEGWTLQSLGFTLQHAQRMDAARACWQEALTIFTELGVPEANEVRIRLGGESTTNLGRK